MVYETSYPNYLEHYGVKGMKWGVIRSPDKLQKYKTREKQNVDFTYGPRTYKKDIDKAVKIRRNTGDKTELEAAIMKRYIAEGKNKYLKSKIDDMTFEEAMAESKAYMKDIRKDLIISGVLSASVNALTGHAYRYYKLNKAQRNKFENMISDDDRKRIEKRAYKKTKKYMKRH